VTLRHVLLGHCRRRTHMRLRHSGAKGFIFRQRRRSLLYAPCLLRIPQSQHSNIDYNNNTIVRPNKNKKNNQQHRRKEWQWSDRLLLPHRIRLCIRLCIHLRIRLCIRHCIRLRIRLPNPSVISFKSVIYHLSVCLSLLCEVTLFH
jgi:hypothetical protein